MKPLSRGRFEARLAMCEAEVAAAQTLRHRAFWAARGRARADGRDWDQFDATADHMLICDRASGAIVGCYRVQVFAGEQICTSYAAQFYDLTRLCHYPGPMMEMGRFCLDPDQHDPDILRLAWAAMTRLVDTQSVALLFGCSSFTGADPGRHAAALRSLRPRIAPSLWAPNPKSGNRIDLAAVPEMGPKQAPALPALLRTYLSMGGWVSDHAVIDTDLDTLHVLTGVEIAQIPPARARALRMIAGDNVGV